MYTQYLHALIAAIVATVVRFFTPSIDRILADFQKKIAQLNRVIDQTYDQADAARVRRNALREQLQETYAEERRCEEAAMRASKVRQNLENIINA